MRIGTKSVLFGAHCFFIHPWFLALAWLKLYGFRKVRDRYAGEVSIFSHQLWAAFFLHDLGYWGKPDMDGEEGEQHPYWAAKLMTKWFGLGWGEFCLYHSRYLSKRAKTSFSLLCVADKLAIALDPRWVYLLRVIASGEIHEYMALAGARYPDSKYAGEPPTKYESAGFDLTTRWSWCTNMQEYCRNWAFEHKDGKDDTWTPEVVGRIAVDETGVWK